MNDSDQMYGMDLFDFTMLPANDQHEEGTARLEIGGTFEITDHFDVPDVVHIATRPDAGTAPEQEGGDGE